MAKFQRTKGSINQIKSGLKTMFSGLKDAKTGAKSFLPNLFEDIMQLGIETTGRMFGYAYEKLDYFRDAINRQVKGMKLQFKEKVDHVRNYSRAIRATNSVFGRVADALDAYNEESGVSYYNIRKERGKNHVVVELDIVTNKPNSPFVVDNIANEYGLNQRSVLKDGRVMYHNDKMSMIVDPNNPRRIKIRSWEKWDAS